MTRLLEEAERRLRDDGLRGREVAAARERAAALFVPAEVAGRLEAAYRHAVDLTTTRPPVPTAPPTLTTAPPTPQENHS
jgi:hypothetical protein